LILLDWLSAGRQASGERWAFRSFSNLLEIDRDGQAVLRESMLLDPAHGPLDLRMGRFNILAVAVISGPKLAGYAKNLLSEINASPLNRHPALVESASPLRDSGIILRMAGMSVEQVIRTMRKYLSFLPTMLGDDPWIRKW
jgi:urease accessory protein